jgi:hypothetical protein
MQAGVFLGDAFRSGGSGRIGRASAMAAQQAAVSLLNVSASLSQISDTTWAFKKGGSVDISQTITWKITATLGCRPSDRWRT